MVHFHASLGHATTAGVYPATEQCQSVCGEIQKDKGELDDCRFCNQLGGTAVILLWYYIRSNYNCAGILVWIPGLTDEEKRTCNCNHCAGGNQCTAFDPVNRVYRKPSGEKLQVLLKIKKLCINFAVQSFFWYNE